MESFAIRNEGTGEIRINNAIRIKDILASFQHRYMIDDKPMKQIWNEKADQLKANLKKEFIETGEFHSHRVKQYNLMKEAAKICP